MHRRKSLRRPLPLTAVGALALALPALGGEVAVFELEPAGTGSVRTYDEQTGALVGAPAELTGIRLLPLEVNRRTALEEFLPGRARLSLDIPLASRVVLPAGQGSLYHYSREVGNATLAFGFFRVTLAGQAQFLTELPGIGAGALDDPFVPRVAIAPSGDAMLVITLIPAGGNVLELDFAGVPQLIDRTVALPPRRFHPRALLLSDTWGVCGIKRAALRFDRSAGAQAQPLDFGALSVPSVFSGTAVLSQNGQWCAITAGSSLGALDVYAFDAHGPAGLATPAPMAISGAGYLPEAEDGPHLAVADDGATCAWRSEPIPPAISRESWVGRVHVPPADPALQVSSDALFLDTLDEIGLFIFRTPARLQLSVGAQPTPGASTLENADLFQFDVPATLTAGSFTNLSLSSGDNSAPFLSVPALTIDRSALIGASTWYMDSNHGTDAVSAVLENTSGAQTVLNNVKQLRDWTFVNGWAWISIRRDDGQQPYEVWRAPADLSAPAVRITSDANGEFSRFTTRPDGQVAFVNGGAATLSRVQLSSGAIEVLPSTPVAFGPTLAVTALGGVAFTQTFSVAGAPVFAVWPPASATLVTLQSVALDGFVLPAN